ncbi:acylphosphatase [Isoptericola sp. NEAU-Y5]|uniref:Acylphosphatase n=1 Tax=Isoptericola luteus TaxID=2879484 RepID=A0ABS7ZF31_9MICO|nr:acylphosphatase [Isoptericola sp. NEAU-Y5]MCA5893650.1 acylphosphatase [Isoptericola sp. NEAU-Y5]
MTVRVRAVVRGRVQGVGFRYATVRAAARHGAAGFVRNLADGSVEAEVEGDRDAVDALLRFLREGPPQAAVRSVEVTPVPVRGGRGFTEEPSPPPTR